MLRHIILLCLVAAAAAEEAAVKEEVAAKPAVAEEQPDDDLSAEPSVKDKRQVAYGAPAGLAPSFNNFGSGLAGGFGGGFGGNFGGGFGGGKCRDETKYVLTWTKTVIPVTEYATRTEYLPSTLYKYVTETQYFPVTQVQLQTTTRAGGREYQEETKIAYRTDTVVVPQVETVYSTLVFTEDEHVTVTETDYYTQTQAQQYPVEVTVTSVQQVPQVNTENLSVIHIAYYVIYTWSLIPECSAW